MFRNRLTLFQNKLAEKNIDLALLTDEENVYYLIGHYDYLHMEFGRPTILVVPQNVPVILITPTIDLNAAQSAAQVDPIAPWNDGMDNEWREELPTAIRNTTTIAVEPDHMPPMVRTYVSEVIDTRRLDNATPLLSAMRMIKLPEELQLARHAGEVATAMMVAGRGAIADGGQNSKWRSQPRKRERARPQICLHGITPITICRPTPIFCKSWLRVTPLSEPTTAPQRGLCIKVIPYSSVFAV